MKHCSIICLVLFVTITILSADELYAFSEDTNDRFVYYELYDSYGWFMSYAIPKDADNEIYIASHRTNKEWMALGPSPDVKIVRNPENLIVELNGKRVLMITKSLIIHIRPEGEFKFPIR